MGNVMSKNPYIINVIMEIEFPTNERRKSRDEIFSEGEMSESSDPCILNYCMIRALICIAGSPEYGSCGN